MGCPGACASEPRLLSASEHELGRTHRAIEELPERAQRERDAGETGMLLRPVRAEREPLAVGQSHGEHPRGRCRPLTAQVGVI
ncbi:MAG: hypothetical protein E6K24_11260 [Gammaproteobacteria bacterium]|nr:MAG: hypothetical protein E6K24_11260 [Gammaproteobacteria bacterium]